VSPRETSSDTLEKIGGGAVSMDDFYNIMTKKTFAWTCEIER